MGWGSACWQLSRKPRPLFLVSTSCWPGGQMLAAVMYGQWVPGTHRRLVLSPMLTTSLWGTSLWWMWPPGWCLVWCSIFCFWFHLHSFITCIVWCKGLSSTRPGVQGPQKARSALSGFRLLPVICHSVQCYECGAMTKFKSPWMVMERMRLLGGN